MKCFSRNIINRLSRFWVLFYNTVYYLCVSIWRKDIVVNALIDQRCSKLIHTNFGDDLNYYLIQELFGRRIITVNNLLLKNLGFKMTNFSCIGSIVDLLGDDKTVIWGAGAILGNRPLRNKPLKVLCVRGPLTRNYLLEQGVDCPECYGDPALLLPKLYVPNVKKIYRVGIVAHYVDLDNNIIHDWIKSGKGTVKLIDVVHYKHWHDIVDEINSCEYIISSSLHGLIVADAYNIPNVWVEFSNKVYGSGFKFRDYYASIGKKNVSPVIVNNEDELEKLITYKESWSQIRFDMTGLVESCPFNRLL